MLREYTARDRENAARMFVDVFTHEPWDYHWMREDKILRYFKDFEETPKFMGFAEDDEGKITGLCFGVVNDYFSYCSYEIKEFVVARQSQRQGLGGRMLEGVAAALREKNVDFISLATQRDIPAFSFYQKNGYQVSEGAVYLNKIL